MTAEARFLPGIIVYGGVTEDRFKGNCAMSNTNPQHQSSMQIRRMSAVEQQMYEDLLWAENDPDLEKQYYGECIVVWKKQVVAHARSEEEALQQAAAGNWPFEELVVVEFPDFFETPH
jgi:hypothetical protein